MRLLKRALLWSFPVWIFLIIENYFLPPSVTILGWINLPGIVLVLALNQTWGSLHDTDRVVYIILNGLIYFCLIYSASVAWSKFRKLTPSARATGTGPTKSPSR